MHASNSARSGGRGAPARRRRRRDGDLDGAAQLALVRPARAPVEGGVAEVVLLHQRDQARPRRAARARRRAATRAAGSARRARRSARRGWRPGARRPRAAGAHHPQHPHRVGRLAGGRRRREAERARGQRDRGVRPLRGAALRAARAHAPGAQVLEELAPACAPAGASVKVRPMSTPGVVVAAADADARRAWRRRWRRAG